ncbi:DUF6192 family protein [Streptomyces sp. NPDC001185]|uniref:DUF6192 family protein n=1 Tax=Streptomyces sp. NPDC001185 TaxID=3154380 RepID=UPI00332FA0FC
MRDAHAQEKSEAPFTVRASLFRLAEDIGLTYTAVKDARWTASKWPKDRRAKGVSFTVHKILASITDPEKRWEKILNPPKGKARWTPDEANRCTGRQVDNPVTPQEKISAIHTLSCPGFRSGRFLWFQAAFGVACDR